MLATLACGTTAFGQELPFTHFTTEHPTTPLASASVQKIYQDRLGYIWIGCYSSGLARYDGHRFEQYSIDDGLTDLTVREMVEDEKGRLWVGTDGGLVVSDKPLSDHAIGERVHFTSKVAGTPLIATRIRQRGLAADRAGWIWVATTGDGILSYRWKEGSLERRTVAAPSRASGASAAVYSILVRRDQTIWASMTGGLLARLDSAAKAMTVTALAGAGGKPLSETSALFESEHGTLWGGCADGMVWRFDDRQGTAEVVNHELESRIFDICEASDGDIWIVSLGSGALRLSGGDPKRSRRLGTRDGLLDETLWSVLRDREGNLWLGQNGGISRLTSDYKAFDYYTGRPRAAGPPLLPGQSAFAVLPPSEKVPEASGHMLVGTSGGFVAIAPDGSTETVRASDGLWNNTVYSMLVDGSGKVWIGTTEGLNAASFTSQPAEGSGRVTLFGKPAVIERLEPHGRPIYSIVEHPLKQDAGSPSVQSVWAGGSGGLLSFDGASSYLFRSPAGLSPTGVTSLAFDSAGFIWAGSSDSGIFRSRVPVTQSLLREQPYVDVQGVREITGKIFAPVWSQKSGAPTNSIRNLAFLDGEIWAATAAGVAVFDARSGRQVAMIDRRNGIGTNSIAGLIVARGRIWVTQNLGIVEIDPRSRKVLRIVNKQDGLLHNEAWAFSSLAAGADGSLYFASPKGVTIFRPWLQRHATSTPELRFRSFDLRQDARGNNQVSIEYAALSFANEQKIHYRTRLAGFEEEWSDPTRDVSIRYTNLGALLMPRTYRFQVIASSDLKQWSRAPLEYPFDIRPAWWLRWWAVLFYAAAIVLGGYLFIRLRTLALERQNAALETLIAERTREIRSQSQQLEVKKREAEQASQAKSTFLANMSHELRTPLNSIIGFSEILVERLEGKVEQKPMSFLRSIASSSHHLLSLINDILDLSKVDAGKMDVVPEVFPVRSAVDGICHVMRGLATKKSQSFEVAIPDNLPYVEADPVKFKQVLSNLLSNAVKFSPPGSVIRVSAGMADPNGELVEISVADPGIGIAAEDLDVIFDEFKQLDSGRSREFGGTGLGLALVKRLVELQGGTVRVTSQIGEGSTFTFTVPTRSRNSIPGTASPPAAQPPFSGPAQVPAEGGGLA